jgi:hypothetical protein
MVVLSVGGCPYVFGQGPGPVGSCGRGQAESLGCA